VAPVVAKVAGVLGPVLVPRHSVPACKDTTNPGQPAAGGPLKEEGPCRALRVTHQ
jgi:hypothetical protein